MTRVCDSSLPYTVEKRLVVRFILEWIPPLLSPVGDNLQKAKKMLKLTPNSCKDQGYRHQACTSTPQRSLFFALVALKRYFPLLFLYCQLKLKSPDHGFQFGMGPPPPIGARGTSLVILGITGWRDHFALQWSHRCGETLTPGSRLPLWMN